MRLENYINETGLDNFLKGTEEDIDKLWSTILEECKPILEIYKKVNSKLAYKHLFYRGMKYKGAVVKGTSRTDRKPKDMSEFTHKFLDDYFYKRFGWRARSKGVFATSGSNQASYYGFLYAFFPIGDFEFIWSPDIDDIIDYSPDLHPTALKESYNVKFNNDLTSLTYIEWVKELKETLKSKLDGWYTDEDIKEALLSKKEVMFKCKGFYGLDCNTRSLQEHIFELIGKI